MRQIDLGATSQLIIGIGLLGTWSSATAQGRVTDDAHTCASLARLPNSTVTFVELVPASGPTPSYRHVIGMIVPAIRACEV